MIFSDESIIQTECQLPSMAANGSAATRVTRRRFDSAKGSKQK